MKFIIPIILIIVVAFSSFLFQNNSAKKINGSFDVRVFQESIKTIKPSIVSLDMETNLVKGDNKVIVTYDESYTNGQDLKDEDVQVTGLGVNKKNCTDFTVRGFECILSLEKDIKTLVTITVGARIKLINPKEQGNYEFIVDIENIQNEEKIIQRGTALAYIEKNIN